MKIITIIGSEQNKFTSSTEEKAREIIRTILNYNYSATIVSGHSPHGGVDIMVEEEFYKSPTTGGLWIRAPIYQGWGDEGQYGYKARNLDLAKSDTVVVIVVKDYPPKYPFKEEEKQQGFRNGVRYCFHCDKANRPSDHVRSGACWVATKHKEIFDKEAIYYVIDDI